MLKTRKTEVTVTSAIQRVVTMMLVRLHRIRGWIIAIAASGIGIMLGFGLFSPARDQVIAIAGTSVYLLFITG